jgi:hypothetical protein
MFPEPKNHYSCSKELKSANWSGLFCSKYCGNRVEVHIQEVGWRSNKVRMQSDETYFKYFIQD